MAGRSAPHAPGALGSQKEQAVRWGLIPRNVCEDVDRPRLRREEMQPLDSAQTRHLLKTAAESEDRFEALYVLAVHTEMRPGELLGLRCGDVASTRVAFA